MDYEQKYKEALEKARQLCAYPTSKPFISDLQDLFPELKEEERIRKELINYIKKKFENSCSPTPSKNTLANWIAWLEKQDENKSSWSEDDENSFLAALWCCKKVASIAKDENEMGTVWYAERWLNSLKNKCTWKPTEKQINAIRLARSFVTDDFSDNPTLSETLKELEEQLNNLI